jgi:hypothetical protein
MPKRIVKRNGVLWLPGYAFNKHIEHQNSPISDVSIAESLPQKSIPLEKWIFSFEPRRTDLDRKKVDQLSRSLW